MWSQTSGLRDRANGQVVVDALTGVDGQQIERREIGIKDLFCMMHNIEKVANSEWRQ